MPQPARGGRRLKSVPKPTRSTGGVHPADQLQEIIEAAKAWPVWTAAAPPGIARGTGAAIGAYGQSSKDIETWIALRESDRDRLKNLMGWPQDREYRVDPLPERIAQAFSDLLFGEDPEIKAAAESDQDALDELIDLNDLPSELRRAAADCSSEGEVWWRIYVDPEAANRPLVEFHSRLDVVPLFRGRKVVACAFVSHLASQEIKLANRQTEMVYWRHVEIQAEGLTRNLLYRGNLSSLGNNQPLTDFAETADLPEEWNHGLDVMLAGRIVNKLGRDYRLGLSDYQGIKDLLLDLNEARSIMAENARLTAKKRMVVPMDAVRDGKWDAGSDVIIHESLDQAMGDGKPGPYVVLEYQFEASQLIEHINALRSAALTGVGLMEQFIGTGDGLEGNAGLSGTALRTRLIPTTLAAKGRGRYWDDAIPEMLRRMQLVDALPNAKMGLGNSWSKADEAPAVERASVLPEDPAEEVDRHVTAVGGEVESVETAVKALHPDWTEEEVKDELDRIKEDRKSGAPEPGSALPGEEPKPGAPFLGEGEEGPNPAQDPRRPGLPDSPAGGAPRGRQPQREEK